MVAYLDPGTGSMLIGAVAAGAAGVGVAMRSTFGRFRRGSKSAEPDPVDDREQDEAATPAD